MIIYVDFCVLLVMILYGERYVGFSIFSWDEIGKNFKFVLDYVKNVIFQKYVFRMFFK